MAFSQSAFLKSVETPKIVKFWSLKALKVLSKLGVSFLHQVQEELQKSTNTNFPLK